MLANFEGKHIEHFSGNSLKLYHEANVLRPETTINDAEAIRVERPPADDPEGARGWTADAAECAWTCPAHRVLPGRQRALSGGPGGDGGNARRCGSCWSHSRGGRREPRPEADRPTRYVRGLNPLAELDAALLTAVSDPRWMVQGLRNRDLVAALYPTASDDPAERGGDRARVTRLLRLLRGHGLLEKIPGSHRYQIGAEAHVRIQAVLACRNANPDQLVKETPHRAKSSLRKFHV